MAGKSNYYKKSYASDENKTTADIKCMGVEFDLTTDRDYGRIEQLALADATKMYNAAQLEEENEIKMQIEDGFIASADEYDRQFAEPFSLNNPICAAKVDELTQKYARNVTDLPNDIVVTLPKEKENDKEAMKAAIQEKYGYTVTGMKGYSKATSSDLLHNKTYDSISNAYLSEDFKKYLDLTNNLKSYSLNNICLVMSQKPDAEAVKGFYSWKEFDRGVGKGEKGIQIWSPTTCVVKNEEDVDKYLKRHHYDYGKSGDPKYEKKKDELLEKIKEDGKCSIFDGVKPTYVWDIKQTVSLTGKDNLTELLYKLRFEKPLEEDMHNFDTVVAATEKAMGMDSGALKLDYSVSQQEALFKAVETYAHKIFSESPESVTGIKTFDKFEGAMHRMETKMAAYLITKHIGIEGDDKISYEMSGIMKDRLSDDSIRIGRREMFTQTYNRAVCLSKQFIKEFDKALEEVEKQVSKEDPTQTKPPKHEKDYVNIYENIYKNFISDNFVRMTLEKLDNHVHNNDPQIAENAVTALCGEVMRQGVSANEIIAATPEAQSYVERAKELKLMPPHKAIPVIMQSEAEARKEGATNKRDESIRENIECAEFMVKSLYWNAKSEKDEYELDKMVEDISPYSKERIDCILAASVYPSAEFYKRDIADEGFSQSVKEWAKNVISSYDSFNFDNFRDAQITEHATSEIVNKVVEYYKQHEKEIEKQFTKGKQSVAKADIS